MADRSLGKFSTKLVVDATDLEGLTKIAEAAGEGISAGLESAQPALAELSAAVSEVESTLARLQGTTAGTAEAMASESASLQAATSEAAALNVELAQLAQRQTAVAGTAGGVGLAEGGVAVAGGSSQGAVIAELAAIDGATVSSSKNRAKAHQEVAAAEKVDAAAAGELAKMTGGLGEAGAGATEKLSKLGNLLGPAGGVNVGLAAGVIGVGALIEGGKALVELSDQQEAANKSLEQSWTGSASGLEQFKQQITDFITANSKYVTSQSEVTEGYASMTRAGFSVTQADLDMGTALDLSKLKHISLTEAVKDVILAEQGHTRALVDLGINTKAITAANQDASQSMAEVTKTQSAAASAHQNLTSAQRSLKEMEDSLAGQHKLSALQLDHLQDAQNRVKDATDKATAADKAAADAKANAKGQLDAVAIAMADLRDKTKDGRKATTDLDQASTDLGNRWQDIARVVGPELSGALAGIEEGIVHIWDGMIKFGQDDQWWKGFNDGLINVLTTAKEVLDVFGAINDWVDGKGEADALSKLGSFGAGGKPGVGSFGRAGGGPVLPGMSYTVGETGPETLVMGRAGGYVIPNAHGGAGAAQGAVEHHTHLTLNGTPLVNDPEAVARMLRRQQLVGAGR